MRGARGGAAAHASGQLRWSAGRGLTECGACGYLGRGMSGGRRCSDVVQAGSVRCGHRPRRWGRAGCRMVGGGMTLPSGGGPVGQETYLPPPCAAPAVTKNLEHLECGMQPRSRDARLRSPDSRYVGTVWRARHPPSSICQKSAGCRVRYAGLWRTKWPPLHLASGIRRSSSDFWMPDAHPASGIQHLESPTCLPKNVRLPPDGGCWMPDASFGMQRRCKIIHPTTQCGDAIWMMDDG